ncbi:MAG: hypothetical protein M3Z04_09935 [Chloroflexota bacterium]|nr:hypothetical protein [Chloroflexota bacterium]
MKQQFSTASERPVVIPDEIIAEPPAVHLRIDGRHGVFVLLRGAGEQEQAIVDTRLPNGPACTCGVHGCECEHVILLRACGFLSAA